MNCLPALSTAYQQHYGLPISSTMKCLSAAPPSHHLLLCLQVHAYGPQRTIQEQLQEHSNSEQPGDTTDEGIRTPEEDSMLRVVLKASRLLTSKVGCTPSWPLAACMAAFVTAYMAIPVWLPM